MDTEARAAVVLNMLAAFPAASSLGIETVDVFVAAVDDCSLDAIERACWRFIRGEVDRDNPRFPPSAPEFAEHVRMLDRALGHIIDPEPLPPGPPGYRQLPNGDIVVPMGAPMPAGYDTCGDIEVDFGHGKIDLRGMTRAERDEVYRLKGLPETKRIGGARPLPRLQRMG